MSPQYYYSAKNWQGETVSSSLKAINRSAALDLLYSKNLVPFHLKEQGNYLLKLRNETLKLFQRLGYHHYSNRNMMIFCRQFATMLQAGLTILQCLQILSKQDEIASLKNKIRTVALEVEHGSSLNAALRFGQNSFPVIMVNMIEAGETGGALETIMKIMADHFEKQHDLQEKIRSATLYPIFIIGIAIVVMAVMILFVLPQFAQIFYTTGMEMPLYTYLLLYLGNTVRENWLLLLIFSFLTVISLALYRQTKKGRQIFDQLRLRLPLFGKIYCQTLSARFSRILGTLLAGGVSLHSALELVDKVIDNQVISESINEIGAAVRRGENIADPLQKIKYFPPLLSEMVRIGEETGALEKTLDSTAIFYEREVSYFVERLSTIVEPILLLFVGLFIGMLVFSILSPMYQVFQMI
jgi:type IV pilus assembly protein PilC